ncbi:hypothetical protein UFOVP222_120 [uncultured Caudovirales phage]|uniref:Uncharacterized protein n=1 Tax=uncultured Caudovirales phage TaxID=2100421 RepID=A0A6J5TCW9_9CAUD|nr:hypothetical protein UFOVP108_115 [uncultured Caudovirales phage]CAB5219725.1 hypothetical protein UFOVP222_120 [uncultured Caudovirales phage]
MHTLQWVIVEAEDVDTAAENAESLLNQEMGDGEGTNSWYDWFVVGGGRWNDEQDPYHNSSNMIIAFEDNPNAFNAKIQELIANRIDNYNEYLAEAKQQDIMAKLENYGGVMTYDPSFYPIARLIAYQQGKWDYDSKVYDLVHWSTNITHILSKIDNGLGENLYLVPIDFHF